MLKANTPPGKKGCSSRKFLSLFLILFLAVGNVWADTQTYSFASSAELSNLTYTPGNASDTWNVCTAKTNSVEPRDGGFVQYKCAKSSTEATFVTKESFENITNISFFIASSDKGKTQVKIEVSPNADFSSDVTEIVNASTGLSGLGISSPSKNTWYSVSKSFASKSGYVRFTMTSSSSGKYWSFDDIVITYTPSSGGDPVCPETLTITSKDSKTAFLEGDAIELTAALSEGNGAITYQWYKGGTAEENKLAGKTAAKLEIASCVEGDAGDYYCVASKSDCSDAVNADAFTITVTHNPCATYFWFFNDADQTANGKTNATSVFSNMVGGSSNLSGSITIDETTYNVTRRSGDADPLGRFTVPANKAATFYTLAVSSGDGARKIVLTNTATSATYEADVEGGNGSYKRVQIDNIAPGTYTIGKSGGNTRLGMVALKVCDATFRTITLEYADGTTPDGSLSVLDGTAATRPADPTWEHHRFDGWYNGENPYDWTANVTGDLTLTAHWTQLYTITYAAGDGTATGDAPTQVDKAEGETFEVAANTFEVAGKDFVKWNDGTNDYAPGATYTVGTDNVVLTAQWKAAADKYTVIFKDGTTELGTKLFDVTTNPSDADIDKTKALNTFAAWQKEGVDIALDDAFWATVAKDAEITLTARWAKAFATSYDMEEYAVSDGATLETLLSNLDAAGYAYTNVNGIDNGHTHNYIYDGMKYKTNDGDLSFNVNAGKLVIVKTGNLPANALTMYINGVADPTVFVGANEAVETHVNNYFYSAVEALYRLDIQASKGTCAIKAVTITDPFTVSFDANGGDAVAPLNGTPSVMLPLPTKGTESFLGWFDGETKVGEAGDKYTPAANITLKAHWEAVSTDARLASITFSSDAGTLSPAFDPEVTNYTYTMPYGTAAVPTITGATSVSAKAQEPQIISQASAWGETAVIRGVAESSDTKAYNITMLRAPKDGVSIIKVATTGGTNKTVTGLYAGEGDVNLSGSKKMDGGKYIGFTLDGTTLQAGDRINVHTTTASTSGGSHIIFYDNMTDKTELYDTEEIGGVGNNIFTINAAMVGKATAYVYRSDADAVHKWNGYIDYIEVTRPMNPVLTAITINDRDGVIDPLDDKHFNVTIPYEADLANLTIVDEVVWNAPAASGAKVVTSNSGNWVIGDNTYRLTDKDGDQTTYTITLTQAAASADATLKTLTINGNALTLVDGVYEYDYELPYGTTATPTVVAEKNDAGATAVVTSVSLTEAVITVTAENGTTQEYVINFTISPWQNIVIWDGSTMDAVAASPDASGLTWEVNGFKSIDDYPTTCGSKTYSNVLPSGGSASDSRNFKIVIPDGYLAKFYIAFASHSDGELRGMSIGTTINKNLDTSIYGAECSTRSEALGGTSVIVGAGTYYINPLASIDFCEVSVLLRPGYTRTGLTVGSLGTICLPSNVPAGHAFGATFYELVGKEPQYGKIVFDEILSGELVAGKPYLFQAQSDVLYCFYGTESVSDPDNSGAMKGTFVNLTLTDLTNIYYFAQKALWSCVDLSSLSVPANRAYVKMDEMPAISESNPAPGVRRITLGVNGQQVATGVDQVQGDEVQSSKVIINGQMFIYRNGKMYDAQGKLVK